MSCFREYTASEIVKAYTLLMQISEPDLVNLLAKISTNSPNEVSVERLAADIKEWCEEVKPLETSASVEENIENELSIIVVSQEDSDALLIKEFFEQLTIAQSRGCS